MKTTIRKKAPVLLLASALVMIAASASAATIYNNTTNDSNLNFGPTTQYGDEIVFAGTDRVLTDFSFYYWATQVGGTFGIQATIRFYRNDGPFLAGTTYRTPLTSIYTSIPFTITPTFRSAVNYAVGDFPGGVALNLANGGPISNMTWTVEFTNLGDDSAGLTIFNPPTVGSSPALQGGGIEDYWEFAAGAWSLKTNVVAMNFAARFVAVPEPSAVVIGILGGLGLLLVGRRFIKAGT